MGSILKERREELGREIEDIARETRINTSYLRAIEQEDYSFFPVEVYGKGYIREYAKHLGVSEENALAPYVSYIREKTTSSAKVSCAEAPGAFSASEGFGSISGKIQKTGPRKGLNKVFWIIPFAAAAIALYSTLPGHKSGENIPLQPLPLQEAAEETPESIRGFAATGPSEATAMEQKKHNLDITATDRVWVRVVADGAETKEALLQEGDKMNIQGDNNFRIVVGNAAGLKMIFDGKELPPLGKRGEVVKMSLPAETETPPPSGPVEKE